MSASDYPVTFKFGATTSPYSIDQPHTGADRAMPMETDIYVGDTLIALSGGAKGLAGSGQSTGPHLHIQKLVNGAYVNPGDNGLDNTIAFPARVIEVGTKSDVGNYVRIIDAKGVRWSYFHLFIIHVKVGQIINRGDDMAKPTYAEVLNIWRDMDMGNLSERQQNDYVEQDVAVLYRDIATYKRDRLREVPKSAGLTPEQQTKIAAAEQLAQSVKELLK